MIMKFTESYYQTILTYSELISNSIHTFTGLLPNNSKHCLESLNGHLNKTKNCQLENSQLKLRKVKYIILLSTILEIMIDHGLMGEKGLTPSAKKDISSPQYRRSPRNLKFSQPLVTRNICGWVGDVYREK